MSRYIVRRLGQALIVVILVSVIVFVVLHRLPGGVAAMLGKDATPSQVALLRQQLGVDKPIVIQYFTWLKSVLSGDLGFSIVRNQPVTTLLGQYLPRTMLLAVLALIVALLVATVVGLVQAHFRNGPVDYILTATFLGLYATPAFFLAVVLVYLFAIQIHLFPAQAPQDKSILWMLAHPAGLVLPVCVLAGISIAVFSRYIRAAGIQNLAEDYVNSARAKGAGPVRIMVRHVLRNTLLPVITLVGLSLPFVFSGALVVESVFNYPGIGLLFWQAATTHDYPILLALTLVVSTAVVVGSLLADILYAVADPRVRYAR